MSWKEKITQDLLRGKTKAEYDKDPRKHFILPWLDTVEVISAEKLSATMAKATFRFPVQHEFLNSMGTLHAGAAPAFFEVATTWTLYPIAKPGFWKTLGLCRTLNCVFLRPAVEDEMLLMDCETVHVGKRICLIKAAIKREKDGAVLITCEHNKFNVDADAKI